MNVLTLLIALITLCFASCGIRPTGWQQSEKDLLTDGCLQQARVEAPSLDEGRVRSYCFCYQQQLERTFPDVGGFKTMSGEAAAREAQKCIDVMLP